MSVINFVVLYRKRKLNKSVDSMLPCIWFSYRSQMTSKCGKNISDARGDSRVNSRVCHYCFITKRHFVSRLVARRFADVSYF